MAIDRMGSFDTLNELLSDYAETARNPELVFAGEIVRNDDGAIVSAPVVWPNGMVGEYRTTVFSTVFPGAIDAYTITYGVPAQFTFTQPLIARDEFGRPVNVPAIEVN